MPRFLQLHTLTSYPASLLNRDDVGFAKRIPFGGSERVRISSQCLKRHWRRADDEHALDRIEVDGERVPMSVRSRRTFEHHLFDPLVEEGVDAEVAQTVVSELIDFVLPEGKAKQAAKAEAKAKAEGGEEEGARAELRTEQVTVIGRPEVDYLLSLAREAAGEASSAKEAGEAVKKRLKELRKNLEALADGIGPGAGLDAALFGRMVTGDVLARCDAAVHVAHAFTVHPGAFETDYFSAVDDLQGPEETGSGHINTAELTSGLYYGYVVVDVPLLVSNLTGAQRTDWQSADRALAGEVARRLVHLVTRVTPGAKLGSTAPYARSLAVLAESGDSQPRTLANAFLDGVPANGNGLLRGAYAALARHLEEMDSMYGRDTARRLAAVEAPEELIALADERTDLPNVAAWAAAQVQEG
ncbi:MAG: type I-E CRISPR-associated protein Cas7/Cse4/CasC [Thermoanaerobaculia bacterium]